MTRRLSRVAPLLLLLIGVPACSGPSAPSSTTATTVAAALPATIAPEPGAPMSAAASGGFEFLGSDPGPGSDVFVTESISGLGSQVRLERLIVNLTVHFNQSLPDARAEVALLDDNGRPCANGSVARPVAPGHIQPVSITVGWEAQTCGIFPASIVTLRATLMTFANTPPGVPIQRINHVVQTFPVRYTMRYPPPPPNPPQALPAAKLEWAAIGPSGGDWPIPGDPIAFWCTATETDGAPLTVRITQRWEGLAPIVHTKAFPAGASSSSSGALFQVGGGTRNPPRATIECVVTNDRGQHAVQTIKIGTF